MVEELLGRLHRPPKLLASFIRHTAIPIRLRTESDTLRRLQYFGAACFGLIDEAIMFSVNPLSNKKEHLAANQTL